MPEQPNKSTETEIKDLDGIRNNPSWAGSSAAGGETDTPSLKDAPASIAPAPETTGFKKMLNSFNAFLESLDEKEPEEPPPPGKSLKESVRDLLDRCGDREKRRVMLRESGKTCWTVFFYGTVVFFLFTFTILATIRALDYSESKRVKFFPPDKVMDYLTAEHEAIETAAIRNMPQAGKEDSIPFDSFDAKLIETVRPIRIYGDEYGIYFMTSKDRYNGEHGIFIAKDIENMPPDLNWGLIEGRIYTYANFN